MKKLFDYLEELRRRPEPARRRVLVLTASSLTVAVFLIWLLNFKFLTSPTTADQTAASGSSDALERIKAGWQILIKRIKD